jgi:hypothetical protein
MKKATLLVGCVLAALTTSDIAAAQAPPRPKACKATIGSQAGPFANAIVLVLPDGKILPYKMMYRAPAGRVQIDPRRHELVSRADAVEISIVYGLKPSPEGLDVQLEDLRVQTPTVFGPGPLPGDKLREVVTQLTIGMGATGVTIAMQPDYVQPVDRGLVTIDPSKGGKGVTIMDRETQMRFARALENASSLHLAGERVGTSGPSSLAYYAGDVAIGAPGERGAMLQQAIRAAATLATAHPEQCS